MEDLMHYIYMCLGALVGIVLFIAKKDARRPLLMLLLSLAAFYTSAYVFYFSSKPFNVIYTGLILFFWIIILWFFKKYNSKKERGFWYSCVLYVAVYHVLHYIFDPLADENLLYAIVFVIYTKVGVGVLVLYYFFRVHKR